MSSGRQKRRSRHRAGRRYEEIVAWIVVPVIMVALVYAGIEMSRQFSGTPVMKLFGGQ